MRFRGMVYLGVVCLLLGLAATASADVPTSMNVQGQLTDNDGVPIGETTVFFTFKIYDAETIGSEIWPAGPGEDQVLTTNKSGLWNAHLGAVIPLTEAVFADSARWLEVTVDTDGTGPDPAETLSRIQLNTNPYTYRAASSQQADTADYSYDAGMASHAVNADSAYFAFSIADDSVTTAKLAQDAVTSEKIANETIEFVDIGQNGANEGEIIKFNGTGWEAAVDEGSAGLFPAPAFDSDWLLVAPGASVLIQHNLGYAPDRYVIDMVVKGVLHGVTNLGIGQDAFSSYVTGAYFKELNTNSIRVKRGATDSWSDYIRVRIWVVQ